jgi:hypothetical protein
MPNDVSIPSAKQLLKMLSIYDAACRAEACAVDEAKSIRDVAMAAVKC